MPDIFVGDLVASLFVIEMENAESKLNHSFAPHIALVLTQFMFGTATVLGKFALLEFPPYALVGFRVGGAALAFYCLQRWRGNLQLDERKHYLYFAVFAFFGIALNQLLFFKGLSLTTATNTSLLAVTIPIFATVISVLIGNDSLGWRKIVGIILAACGVIYLIDPSKASFSSTTTQGDICIVLNSLCYAIYVAISKKMISHYGALKAIAWLFLFGSIINVPMGLYSLSTINLVEISVNGWIFAAALVIFPTICAYYLNAFAIARVEPSVVAVYIYLQPLLGFVMAIFFLGEHFSFRLLISAIFVFAGVFLVTRKSQNRFR